MKTLATKSLVFLVFVLIGTLVSAQGLDIVFGFSPSYGDRCASQTMLTVNVSGHVYGYKPSDGACTFLINYPGGESHNNTLYPTDNGSQWVFSFKDSMMVSAFTGEMTINGLVKGLNTTARAQINFGPSVCLNLQTGFYADLTKDCTRNSGDEDIFKGYVPLEINYQNQDFLDLQTKKMIKGDRVKAIPFSQVQNGITRFYTPRCNGVIILSTDTLIQFAYDQRDSSNSTVEIDSAKVSISNACGSTATVKVTATGKVYGGVGAGGVDVQLTFDNFDTTFTVAAGGSGSVRTFTFTKTFNNVSAGTHGGFIATKTNVINQAKKNYTANFGPGECLPVSGNIYFDKNGNCEYNDGVDELITADSLPMYIGSQLVWAGPDFQVFVPKGQKVYVAAIPFTKQNGNVFRKYKPTCTYEFTTQPNSVVNISYNYKDSVVSTASIDLSQAFASMSVYPNPASNEVNLDLPELNSKISIAIVDLCGKVRWQGESDQKSIKIDLADLASGIYLLTVSAGTDKQTRKLVIK